MEKLDINQKINELKNDGITVLENQYTEKQCDTYISKFDKIINKFKISNVNLNNDCQLIRNPYRHNTELANLIYNENVDNILTTLIDENYILVNSTIVNRQVDKTVNNKGDNMGSTWHTDSHYVGGKRLDKGITYIAITLFDDFTESNGGTYYIPNSHLRREIPNRTGYENEQKSMQGKRGSVILFDGGMWHRGGLATEQRRWSMFSYYGPWFLKPYFNFPEMLGEKFGKETSKELRRLFHYNSIPPIHEDIRINTVTKE
tara:strand:- start:136 stop:915 length:780 start_codon:yes stop_codon:yes gene_type:complete